MPTIHVSDDLMEEIKANKRSDDEPPTLVLERMLDMDQDQIEQLVENKILEHVVEDALVQ